MWDPGTALLATAVVAGGALAVPPPRAWGRGLLCGDWLAWGDVRASSWAPTVAALGLLSWFVAHWALAVRHDVRSRSRIALWVIDRTPLRWTISRYWQLRRQRRQAADTS